MQDCPDGKCQAQKVSWKALGTIVISLIGVFAMVVLYAMDTEKKQNDKISEIPVIQQDVEHIKDSVKEIKNDVKEIRKRLNRQIDRDDLNRLIESVKNGK